MRCFLNAYVCVFFFFFFFFFFGWVGWCGVRSGQGELSDGIAGSVRKREKVELTASRFPMPTQRNGCTAMVISAVQRVSQCQGTSVCQKSSAFHNLQVGRGQGRAGPGRAGKLGGGQGVPHRTAPRASNRRGGQVAVVLIDLPGQVAVEASDSRPVSVDQMVVPWHRATVEKSKLTQRVAMRCDAMRGKAMRYDAGRLDGLWRDWREEREHWKGTKGRAGVTVLHDARHATPAVGRPG
ncbi:uncharacterized protein J3D65DRAFT_262410 [Phyllosticta citribraziliensis]|uniref:Secreted protein n=1 Tax=Phyllosticta citribraziliensis TaxID=989973 RepID=A0ABR1M0K7_9PEZI